MSLLFLKQWFNHATNKTIATSKFNEAKMPEKNFKLAIIYIDFTKSTIMSKIGNLINLHNEIQPNPFEILLSAFVRMLWDHIELDLETNMKYIRLYGFGCIKTEDKSVFYLHPNDSKGASGKTLLELETNVLNAYRKVRNEICLTRDNLSGPTDYSPSIYNTLNLMIESKSSAGELPKTFMGMLLDGQTDHEDKTKKAIGSATFFPVSIVLCAIGNNSFKKLKQYDELGNFTFKDDNNFIWTTKRDIVQSTLANNFVLWVMRNQRKIDDPRYKPRYDQKLKLLKSDIMNEIPTQTQQITSDIINFSQSKHGSLRNSTIPVYDCERKTLLVNTPTVPTSGVTTTAQSSRLADLQSDQQLPPHVVTQIESDCQICSTNKSDSILNPCGHLGICSTCANILIRNHQSCPFCRQQILSTQRAYQP